MKDSKKKIFYIAISLIVVLGMFSTLVLNFKPQNSQESFIATVEQVKQLTGFSKVTVLITEQGIKKYPEVRKYQIYDKIKGNAISANSDLNKTTVVFPSKKGHDVVTVKFYANDNKEVFSQDIELQNK